MLSRRMLVLRGLILLAAPTLMCPAATAQETAPPVAQAAPANVPPRTAPPAQSDPAARTQPVFAAVGVRLEVTLEQALKIAIDNNLGLEIERAAMEVASYQYVGSWGSFDPRVTASAVLTDSEFEATNSLIGANVLEEDTQEVSAGLKFPLTTGGEFNVDYGRVSRKTNSSFQLVNPSTSDTMTLSLRQPLWRGAWQKYATSTQRESELSYRKSEERFRQVRQQLLLDVHSAYWDLVASIEQLGVAEATLELGRRQLDQNERRLSAGVGTGVEVLQAEANVARRIEERLLADVNVRAAQDKLKAALFPGTQKASWDTHIVPITPLPSDTGARVPSWDSALVLALENRSELRQQRLEIDAGDLRLQRAKSERRFGLDLELSSTSNGFDGESNEAFEGATSYEFPSHRAALVFDLPIRNRAASNAERAERVRGRSARLVYDQLESQVVAEVREAVRQIAYQTEAVKAAEKSLELARRQLDAEEARYREGLSTNFQVLEFQKQLAESLSSEKRARVAYAKALAALAKAQGILGEQERR